MRRIERTTAFQRDFKREKKGQHRREVDSLVSWVVSLLLEDAPLPEKNCDHGGVSDCALTRAIKNSSRQMSDKK